MKTENEFLDTTEKQSCKSGVISSCSGQYYNFKKGVEICSKKETCKFFNKDYYNHLLKDENKIRFDKIHHFRLCSLHLTE
jgi:hypothetical protein